MEAYTYNYLNKNNIFLQKVYFIASGTNCKDVIKSIDNANSNSSSIFSFFKGGSSNKKDCSLVENGLQEIFMTQNNNKINKNLLDLNNTNSQYFTGLNISNIESGFVFCSSLSSKNISICPIPFLSKNEKISNNSYNNYKKKITINKNNEKKYWETKEMKSNADYSIIRKKVPNINWNYCDGNGKLYKLTKYDYGYSPVLENQNILKNMKKMINVYNVNKFMELLKMIIINQIEYNKSIDDKSTSYSVDNFIYHAKKYEKTESGNKAHLLKNIVIICDSESIKDILKKNFSSHNKKKFNISSNIIENSSVWCIDFEINRKINVNNAIEYDYDLNNFEKIYPTEYNHSPLKYVKGINTNTFSYNLNNYKFILFNSLKKNPISIKYLRKINLGLCDSKIIISNKIKKHKNKENVFNSNNNNIKSIIKVNKNVSFNNMLGNR